MSHHPHPHHPHHHAWFYNAEDVVSAATFAAILRKVADDAAERGAVSLGTVEVALPAEFDAVVRHERAPHGALVLKIEAEWPESAVRRSATTPSLSELLS